jgi:hypothetical protein
VSIGVKMPTSFELFWGWDLSPIMLINSFLGCS